MQKWNGVTDEIDEVVPGVFRAVMWVPTSSLLGDLLDPSLPYVMVWNHWVVGPAWSSFRLPVASPIESEEVLASEVTFDFVVSTKRFLELLPSLRHGIRAVQLRQKPQPYLQLNRIDGSERFRLLNECGWHVLLDTPGNDFGQVYSPSRDVVKAAIGLHRDRA